MSPVDPPRRVRVDGDLFHPRVPAGAVYVGRAAPGLRASPWANRHRVGTCRVCRVEHDQQAAVNAYTRDLASVPELLAAARRELSGRDLACWCRLDGGPCHADVLLALVGVPVRIVSPGAIPDDLEGVQRQAVTTG